MKNHEILLVKFKLIIDGKIKTISTSKIRKIIVIKKNCIENGAREEHFWSNPHSNEESFSRSNKDFFEKKIDNIITKLEMKEINKNRIMMFIINLI